MFHIGETKEQKAERHRKEGRSEQEIAYFQAENQKDYEPILKDPNTPEKVVNDIVDRITLVPLKILAFKHPNISERSQRYMLEKADKKKYQKELIEAYITSDTKISGTGWIQMRRFYNTAQRFDKAVIELLNEQADIPYDKLDIMLNNLGSEGIKKEKMLVEYIGAITNHKNFKADMLDGDLFLDDPNLMDNEDILKVISTSTHKKDIYMKFYEITQNEVWLPQEAKDLFLF